MEDQQRRKDTSKPYRAGHVLWTRVLRKVLFRLVQRAQHVVHQVLNRVGVNSFQRTEHPSPAMKTYCIDAFEFKGIQNSFSLLKSRHSRLWFPNTARHRDGYKLLVEAFLWNVIPDELEYAIFSIWGSIALMTVQKRLRETTSFIAMLLTRILYQSPQPCHRACDTVPEY